MSQQASALHASRTFHLLTEAEVFSEFHGGAISRWVANVMQAESQSIVLAPSADGSWGYTSDRVRIVSGLRQYKRMNDFAGRLLRWPLRKVLLRRTLYPALEGLRAGDTLWVHNRPEFAAAIAPRMRRLDVRLVLHLHNSHLLHWPVQVLRCINADCCVFVSHFLEQQARAHYPALGRSEVLHNGADHSIFYPLLHRRSVSIPALVLFAGRLVPDKGLHVFIEAMRVLFEKGVAIEGCVLGGAGFGDAPQTAYIKDQELRASENVRFESYCSGAALGERFRDADIFCMPVCWEEPLGMVVIEAMASGLPVVASRSGGIPEMLAEGGGLLVDRGSVEQLADALELLATNVSLRQRLAREALASFQKNFTWDVVRGNYRRIVESVQTSGTLASEMQSNALHPMPMEAECTTFQRSA